MPGTSYGLATTLWQYFNCWNCLIEATFCSLLTKPWFLSWLGISSIKLFWVAWPEYQVTADPQCATNDDAAHHIPQHRSCFIQCFHIFQTTFVTFICYVLELIPDEPQSYPFQTLNMLLPSAECEQLWPKFLPRLARLEMRAVILFQVLTPRVKGCSVGMKVAQAWRLEGPDTLDGLGQRFFSYAIRPHEWVED